jgi:hypothetical protein
MIEIGQPPLEEKNPNKPNNPICVGGGKIKIKTKLARTGNQHCRQTACGVVCGVSRPHSNPTWSFEISRQMANCGIQTKN